MLTNVIIMSLMDPIPNYEEIMVIILPFNILVALVIGFFYLLRYKKTKTIITILWALGFVGVGIGIAINFFIRYIFYDYFNTILPASWDQSLFMSIGMLIITYTLGLSTFYIRLFKIKTEKTGRILITLLTIIALIFLIINTLIPIAISDIGSIIIRILAIWVIIFFTYFSINSKNYRIFAITIGLIFATISGILMSQFDGTQLGLIGNYLQFGFYGFISYGLFFTRQKSESE